MAAEEGEVRVEIVKPLKVIACICAWLGVVLIIVALVTSHWLEADGFYQGLWEFCVAGRSEVICSSATDKAWLMASGVLTIIALLTCFVASILTCVGLLLAYRRSSWRKRRSCFCSAAVVMFLAVLFLLTAIVVYPVMFIAEIDDYRIKFNITQWYFSWSYGIACGAAIFLLGSAVLLAIGKETTSIEYREKPRPY